MNQERGEDRNAIHIRTTSKNAGYPVNMLVFAWEGIVEGRNKKERDTDRNSIQIHCRITGKHAGYPARLLVFAWEGMVEGTKGKRMRENPLYIYISG